MPSEVSTRSVSTIEGHTPVDRRTVPDIAVKDLATRSDRAGLTRLVFHIAAICASGVAIWLAGDSWLLVPLLPLHGILIAFLFCPLHETVHRTAMRSRRLNDIIAFALGAVVLLPSTNFREFHFAHHRYTQIPGKDPELSERPVDTWPRLLVYTSGLSYWWDQVGTILRHAIGRFSEGFMPKRKHRTAIWEARILLLVYTSVLAASIQVGSDAAIRYWLGPLVLGMPVLRLYLLAEHKLCPFVPNIMQNTRTTRTNAVVRLIAWNMPYHGEHHAFPAVPFHRLPELHGRLASHGGLVEDGYCRFLARFVASLSSGKV